MNPKICKRISRQTDLLLLEWFRTIVPESDHDKIDEKNLHQYLPESRHFFVNRQIRLSFYSPKWVRKCIKKLVKLGREVESITMADLESYTKNRGVSY